MEEKNDLLDDLWDDSKSKGGEDKEESMASDLWDDGQFPDENEESEAVEDDEEDEVVEGEEEIGVPEVTRPSAVSTAYTRIPPSREVRLSKKKKEPVDNSYLF